jgi:hypothetical protein
MSTMVLFETLFGDRVRDSGAKITIAQIDRAIGEAVKRYARVRPIEAVQDYTGDAATFDFALPTGWIQDFSTVRAIEYPAGQRPPALLEPDEWEYYRSATTTVKIRLKQLTPSVGETVRVTWTKPHLVDTAGSTIPAHDEEAVSNLAAAVGLRELAAYYANTTDATILADSVNYRSKSSEYLKLAGELEQQYRQHLGIKEGESDLVAGGTFVDVDRTNSLNQDQLTHPKRWR